MIVVMDDAGFTRWMDRDHLRFSSSGSIRSYLSGCRQVEKRGRVALDPEFERDRLAGVLATLEGALAGQIAGWPAPKTGRNYRSHIEAYAEFRAQHD